MFDVLQAKGKDDNKYLKKSYKDITNKKNEGEWVFNLYHILAIHNLCRLIISKKLSWKYGKQEKISYADLIGTQENIEIVKFLGDQLQVIIRKLEKESWSIKNGTLGIKRGKFRRSYFQGACQGLHTQLAKAKREAENDSQMSGLVIYNKEAIQKVLNDSYPNLKQGRANKTKMNGAFEEGYKAGEQLKTKMGIDHGKTNNQELSEM